MNSRVALQSRVPSNAALAVAVIGLGLLLGSVWLVRWKGVLDTSFTLPGVHLTSLAALVVIAVLGRGFAAWSRSTFALICSMFVLDIGTMLLIQLVPLDEQVRLVVGIGSVAFEGIADALALVLFLLALARLPLSRSLAAVVIALLLGNLYRLAFVSFDQVFWAQTGAKLCALGALAYLVRCVGVAPASGSLDDDSAPTFGSRSRPWMSWALPVAVVMAPLMLVRGVYSEMSGLYGIGISSFVNVAVEVLVIWTRLALLVLCLFGQRLVTRRALILGSLALWAAAIVLGLSVPEAEGPFIASAALEVGFTAAQTFLLVLAVRYAHQQPADAAPVIAVAAALTELQHMGKLLWNLAPSAVGEEAGLFSAVSAGILLAIIVALVAMAARARAYPAGEAPTVALEGAGETGPSSILVAQEIQFWERFEALCTQRGLTERETQILQQALHGYTIARTAQNLSLSSETVKTYLARAYGRLGTGGKQGLIELLDAEQSHTRNGETPV